MNEPFIGEFQHVLIQRHFNGRFRRNVGMLKAETSNDRPSRFEAKTNIEG